MREQTDELLEAARVVATRDGVDTPSLRPEFVERVLDARAVEGRLERTRRSVLVSGGLAGAALSVTVAAVVTQRLNEVRMVEAAEVWAGAFEEKGGGE